MYKNKLFLFLLSSLFFIQLANSQNNTNSPYTRFGYGDISDTNSGEQRAMGGVSIGSRSNQSINTVNPASYSSVDSMTFMFDMGISGLASHFSDPVGSKTTFNANLEYITLQFPLSKTVGMSAGLLPYSFVGYNFYTSDTTLINSNTNIPDTIGFTKSFTGLGGISQVYAGLSLNILKHVSLGVNAYYMYGTVNNYRNLSFTNSTGFTSSTYLQTIRANNFRFRFGAQFYNTFDKKHDVSLGLIYESKAKLNGEFNSTLSSVLTETDNKDSLKISETPTIYGIGLNYVYDKRLTIGLDYSMQQWKDAKFFGVTDSLSNRSKLALGLEFIPNPRGRKYSDHIKYRAGFNMSDSYYKVDGVLPPKNFGISFGLGLPLRNSKTILNTTIEYGKIGSNTLLREDYLKLTFNAVFNENWFFKRKL